MLKEKTETPMRSKNGSPAEMAIAGLAGAVVLSLSATPALATIPISVPEPTSLSILGAGVAGLIVAYRMRRRK